LAVAIGDTELLEAPVLGGLLIVISLSEGEGIIYIDAEIPNGALDLCMAEKYLDGAQVARLLVDDGRLSSAQRKRPIIHPSQSDSGHHSSTSRGDQVADLDLDYITSAQLAVDREIEHRAVA
jgi:hypothetical protein